MSIRIRLTPLGLVIQPIRPKVRTPTTNLRTRTIPAPQQRQRSLPIPRLALAIKRRRLPDAQRMANLVHRSALRHVAAVRAEAQVAVVRGLGGGDAGRVVDFYDFGGVGVLGVAEHGFLHCGFDFGVGVFLVGGGGGGLLEGPGYCGRGGAGVCCEE